MSDYEIGDNCNLALFDNGKGEQSKEEMGIDDYPEELVNFAEGLMKHWTTAEKRFFNAMPGHGKEMELIRLMKKYKGKK